MAGRGLFELRRTGVTETWGLACKLSGALSFTKEDRTERYLIIVATGDLLRTGTSLTSMKGLPLILSGIVTAVPDGTEEKRISPSPMGRLSVTVGHADGDRAR